MSADRTMALIRANRDRNVRFKWPLCEVCQHGRASHSPDPGGGWRCRYRGKKRTGERCGCMRFRGELEVIPL